MAGTKGLFRIFIMNLSASDSNKRWNEFALKGVGDKLKSLFGTVVADRSCPYTSVDWYDAWATANSLGFDPGEVLIYFVASRGTGVAVKRGGNPDPEKGGVTWAGPSAPFLVSSEVWLAGPPLHPMNAPLSDPNYQQLLANLAFHELMHNKLDALPKTAGGVLDDLHSQGGGGLPSGTSISAGTTLTPGNIRLMAQNLARRVPQYTGGAKINRELDDGMPILIDGVPAPKPG